MVALPILKATGASRCPVAATLARRGGGAPTTLGGGTVRTGARTGTVALMLDAGTRTRVLIVIVLQDATALVVGGRDEGWKEILSTRRGAVRRTQRLLALPQYIHSMIS